MSAKCIEWLDKHNAKGPKLVFDLCRVRKNYELFKKSFLNIKPYYAVKANPHKKVILLLNNLGSFFDCASISEIEKCISLNICPSKISFGNTIKKEEDIKNAYSKGIRLFAFDSKAELEKISRSAKKSKVFCRIQVPNKGSEWPLSKKFGCSPRIAEKLLLNAANKDLIPIGLSFHVGSQQKQIKSWQKAIEITSKTYKNLSKQGLPMNFLNIGGGFPTSYSNNKANLKKYARIILEAIEKNFGNYKPTNIISEPGRYLVADAGVIETEIILISKKTFKKTRTWVYIDVGRYNGLAETEGEAIKYKIKIAKANKKQCKNENFILAGPSCDSHDIIYEKTPCLLPSNIRIGDKLRIFSTGAYTTVYNTQFNGCTLLQEYYLD